MTISAVGSVATSSGSTTLSVSPTTIGNILVVAIGTSGSDFLINSISGGGVTTWQLVNSGYNISGLGSRNGSYVYLGIITSTGSTTITLTPRTAGIIQGIAAQEFSESSAGGTWNWITVTNRGSPYKAFVAESSVGAVTYSSGDYTNTDVVYPQSSGLVGYPTADSMFIANGSFFYTPSGSTTGFTYTNYGTSNRSQFIYETNLTPSSFYKPTWSTATAGRIATCASVVWYQPPSGPIVMIV